MKKKKRRGVNMKAKRKLREKMIDKKVNKKGMKLEYEVIYWELRNPE